MNKGFRDIMDGHRVGCCRCLNSGHIMKQNTFHFEPLLRPKFFWSERGLLTSPATDSATPNEITCTTAFDTTHGLIGLARPRTDLHVKARHGSEQARSSRMRRHLIMISRQKETLCHVKLALPGTGTFPQFYVHGRCSSSLRKLLLECTFLGP